MVLYLVLVYKAVLYPFQVIADIKPTESLDDWLYVKMVKIGILGLNIEVRFPAFRYFTAIC